jgi:hypothetical protein
MGVAEELNQLDGGPCREANTGDGVPAMEETIASRASGRGVSNPRAQLGDVQHRRTGRVA